MGVLLCLIVYVEIGLLHSIFKSYRVHAQLNIGTNTTLQVHTSNPWSPKTYLPNFQTLLHQCLPLHHAWNRSLYFWLTTVTVRAKTDWILPLHFVRKREQNLQHQKSIARYTQVLPPWNANFPLPIPWTTSTKHDQTGLLSQHNNMRTNSSSIISVRYIDG